MTPAARNVLLGAPFDPYRLRNNAAAYSLSGAASDSTYLTGASGLYYVADRSGNSAVNVLLLPQVTGNRCGVLTGTNIGTGDVSVSLTFQAALSAATAGVVALSSSATTDNVARCLYCETRSDGTGGAIAFNLLGATTSDFRRLSVNNFSSTYAGQVVTVTFTRTGTTFAAYVTTVAGVTATLSGTETTGGTPPAWSDTITSTSTNIGYNSGAETQPGAIYRAAVYSKVLSAAEIIANAAGTMQSSNVVFVDFALAAKLATSFTATSGQTVSLTQGDIALPARIHGARDLYQGLTASMPTYLAYSGSKFGYINGVAGNYFSTPDAAAQDFAGNFSLIFDGQLASWASGSSQNFFGKYTSTGNQRSWNFNLSATGIVSLAISSDGTGANQTVWLASVNTGFSANERGAIRCDYVASTGNVTFYKAASTSDAWSQLGNVIAGTARTPFAGTAVAEVGSYDAGASAPLSGRVLRAYAINGTYAGGSTVADFNPALFTSGTTFTASTGEVWTRNASAYIGNGGEAYFDGVADYLKSAPYSLSQPESVYFVGSQVSWTASDYLYDGSGNAVMVLQQQTGTPQLNIYAGTYVGTTSPAIGSRFVDTAVFNGASSFHRLNKDAAVTGSCGAQNGGGFTLGSPGSGTSNWGNFTWSEALIRSAADADALQQRIAAFEMRKWGIS